MRYVYWIIVIGVCMSLSPGKSIPKDLREWDRWAAAQQAIPPQDVKTFSPTWFGFSSDPTIQLKYANLGATAVIWVDIGAGLGSTTGTSDAVTFSMSNIPEEIRPAWAVSGTTFLTDNSGTAFSKFAMDEDGLVTFQIFNGLTKFPFDGSGWTASGSKGLSNGFFIMYPTE